MPQDTSVDEQEGRIQVAVAGPGDVELFGGDIPWKPESLEGDVAVEGEQV